MSPKIARASTVKRPIALLVSSALIAAMSQLFVAAPARAECEYEGEVYETGETVGSLICMPDSSWKERG